jgi:hypothetical protein
VNALKDIVFVAARIDFMALHTSRYKQPTNLHTQAQSSDELGHRRLVNECCSVFNVRGILLCGLVQTAAEPGVFVVFL